MRGSSRKVEWRIALYLILLLCIMAIAPNAMLEYLRYSAGIADETLWVVHITVFFLTAGFLLMAGGFGIWAYRATMEVESGRRISRMVDAMDYLRDGMIALDKAGRVTGMNPAARELAGPGADIHRPLESLFPGLRPRDLVDLLDQAGTYEVERAGHGGILRFRANHGSGVPLIQISDVTEHRRREHDLQRHAQLQMIGRLARGVAHDFNNVLCAISGYTELMKRPTDDSTPDLESIAVIERETQRGAALARRLMELSREQPSSMPSGPVGREMEQAAEMLQVALDRGWQVESTADPELPPADIADSRLQQMIMNLGLVAASALDQPGQLQVSVRLARPEDESPNSLVLDILAAPEQIPIHSWQVDQSASVEREGVGVIHSVVRTMLEEAGGRLEVLRSTGPGLGFRSLLPVRLTAPRAPGAPDATEPGKERRILLALASEHKAGRLQEALATIGELIVVTDMSSFLDRVENNGVFTGIVVSHALLGEEAGAAFRVVRNLQPHSGIVLMADRKEASPPLVFGVLPVDSAAGPGEVLRALERAEIQIAHVAV